MTGLARIDPAELDVERAAALLAACKDVDQVKGALDRAAAVKVFLRSQKAAISAQNDAAEIGLRAERRLGELLLEQPKAKGAATPRGTSTAPRDVPTLAEQGIDKKLAARAQKLAAAPPERFESHITSVRARAEKITTSGTIAAISHGEDYESDEFYTPPEYIDAAREVLGGTIELDPASNVRAQETVRAIRFLTRADDALAKRHAWYGTTWMNPPYSAPAVSQFAEKLIASFASGAVPAAIALFNASTDTGWFHAFVRAGASVCFTEGRIGFLMPDGKRAEGNRVGQVFFYLGPDHEEFAYVFSKFGAVGRLRVSEAT